MLKVIDDNIQTFEPIDIYSIGVILTQAMQKAYNACSSGNPPALPESYRATLGMFESLHLVVEQNPDNETIQTKVINLIENDFESLVAKRHLDPNPSAWIDKGLYQMIMKDIIKILGKIAHTTTNPNIIQSIMRFMSRQIKTDNPDCKFDLILRSPYKEYNFQIDLIKTTMNACLQNPVIFKAGLNPECLRRLISNSNDYKMKYTIEKNFFEGVDIQKLFTPAPTIIVQAAAFTEQEEEPSLIGKIFCCNFKK